MKLFLSSTVLAFMSFACASVQVKGEGPKPVEGFDIQRYLGVWHQLAAIPASFQDKCLANTRAEYSLLEDGLIKVVNSCDTEGGKRKSSEARGRVNDDYGLSSTLEVTFVKIIKWIWSFAGDYWVIYINDSYDIAIVGHPEYKYGWILSKKETLTTEQYHELAQVLEQQGYDSCRFIMSTTPKQSYVSSTKLCEL